MANEWTKRQVDAARRHTTKADNCGCAPGEFHEVDATDWQTIQTILNRVARADKSAPEPEVTVTPLESFAGLDVGDIVRHVNSGETRTILANYGEYCFAVREQHMANPSEWVLVSKARRESV